jgi:hypothetical protein
MTQDWLAILNLGTVLWYGHFSIVDFSPTRSRVPDWSSLMLLPEIERHSFYVTKLIRFMFIQHLFFITARGLY